MTETKPNRRLWVLTMTLAAIGLAMFLAVGKGERAVADNHQFLLCSGPGETKRADGTAAVANDYIIVVNSESFQAITDAIDQGELDSEAITEDDVQSSGGSFVRSDLSWGMYIPSGYVYQEAGTTNCVLNLKFMMREQGESYFKEAVVAFDNTAPCQGRVWLNTTRDTSEDAAVCPEGAPAGTSGTGTNNGGNSNVNTNTQEPVNTVEEPQNNNDDPPGNSGNPPGNTGGGNTNGGNSGGGNTNGGNSGGGTSGGNTESGNTGGGNTEGGKTDSGSDSQTTEQTSSTEKKSVDDTTEDLLETEEQQDAESDDLMETEDEGNKDDANTTTAQDSGKRDNGAQQTVRPDAPKTGTGGAAAKQSNTGLAEGLTAFLASVAAIGVVSLLLYRRRRWFRIR